MKANFIDLIIFNNKIFEIKPLKNIKQKVTETSCTQNKFIRIYKDPYNSE